MSKEKIDWKEIDRDMEYPEEERPDKIANMNRATLEKYALTRARLYGEEVDTNSKLTTCLIPTSIISVCAIIYGLVSLCTMCCG